jgi:heme/copper-type cytochrome/quinol oxidase subunit 2
MRLVALEVLAAVVALVFLALMVATALHRSARAAQALPQGSALAEYLWALVPWLMMAACVIPAVRRIVAAG